MLLFAATAINAAAGGRWLVILVANRRKGLDFSDESFYVLVARHPASQLATSTDFGFYLRPLLWLSGTSIQGFRMIGVALLLLAVGILAAAFRTGSSIVTIAMAVAMGSVALSFYALWIVSPGYNLLSLVLVLTTAALLIAAIGADERRSDRLATCAGALLGTVITMGAFTKVTAFAAVTVICGLAIAMAPRQGAIRRLALPIIGGGIVAAAGHLAVLAGPPADVLHRFRHGLDALRLLESHSPDVLWETDFVRSDVLPFSLLVLVAALAVGGARRWLSAQHRVTIAIVGALVTGVWFATSRTGGGSALFTDGGGWWWLRLTAFTFVWLALAASQSTGRLERRLAPVVAMLAVAVTIGTNVGFIRQVVFSASVLTAAVAWRTAASLRCADPIDRRGAVPGLVFLVVAGMASWATIDGALEEPYRLAGPLSAASVPTEIPGLGTLELDVDDARYVRDLSALSGDVPPAALSCFVNLTGGTPGAALALNVDPVGAAWLLGGYPGGRETAEYILQNAPCVDGDMLVLEALEGSRSIERPAFMAGRSFIEIGRVKYAGYVEETQVLYYVAP